MTGLDTPPPAPDPAYLHPDDPARPELRDQLAAALVAQHTNGLCPTAGPCEDCDCFDPQHTRELDDVDALLPVVQAAITEARREAWGRAIAIADDHVNRADPDPYSYLHGYGRAASEEAR